MTRSSQGVALSLLAILFANTAFAAPRHPNVASLGKNSREIFMTAMQWGDQTYEEKSQLCRVSSQLSERDSAWYSVGLLLRDGKGDRDRAAQTLDTVLNSQYRDPEKPWFGTFRRAPSDPEPGTTAEMWRDYDPNWREFIGTTLAVILTEYPDRLPSAMKERMMAAIMDAVAGEIKQGRLLPSYTNISLMYGFLWDFAAVRGGKSEWTAQAEDWQKATYALYKEHDAFSEFNSPTYSGVDLYGLALWRDYGFTPMMRQHGEEMEAGLWRTLADLYNANLRNLSGPYDRTYGMDMQKYVPMVGIWLRTALDADQAPLTTFEHPPIVLIQDLWQTSLVTILDTRIPPDAMSKFRAFPGPHQVTRPIEGKRVATAWIGKDIIYGAESTGLTRDVGAHSQFHPVTAQWRAPDGTICWIELTHAPMIDATADSSGIKISADGDVSFRISAPGITADQAKKDQWVLPGLAVHVKSDAKSFSARQDGAFMDIQYIGITTMSLNLEPATKQN